MIDNTMIFFDIVWFWAGRVLMGFFLLGLICAAAGFIADWIAGAGRNIKLLAEFVKWRSERR